MTTHKEALTLALEALENHSGNYKLSKAECVKHEAVVEAIKEVLSAERVAQSEQEPVAEGWCDGCNPDNCQGCGPAAKPKHEPIFWYRPVGEDGGYEGPIHNGAIEKVRKLSGVWKPLYTTPPQPKEPEQEPVAYPCIVVDVDYSMDTAAILIQDTRDYEFNNGQYWLTTTQPQRKPLTDEMVLAGARALAKRHADSCGLDFDDVWKYYSDEHKDDAKVVIEAAHGIKE